MLRVFIVLVTLFRPHSGPNSKIRMEEERSSCDGQVDGAGGRGLDWRADGRTARAARTKRLSSKFDLERLECLEATLEPNVPTKTKVNLTFGASSLARSF